MASSNFQDRDGAGVLASIRYRLRHVFADGAYSGEDPRWNT
jgi:hypothetical protein